VGLLVVVCMPWMMGSPEGCLMELFSAAAPRPSEVGTQPWRALLLAIRAGSPMSGHFYARRGGDGKETRRGNKKE